MKRTHAHGSLLALLTTAIAACGNSPSGVPSGGGENDASLVSDAGDDAAGRDGALSLTADDAGQEASDGSLADAVGGEAGVVVVDAGCPPWEMPSGDTCLPITVRRPFLVGSSMRSAVATVRGDWSRALRRPAPEPDAATARALAQAWLKDALEEHASVAAFARFTMLLLSAGAPPDLVAGSQRASIDEIHHARACFALAERYGHLALGPSPLPMHDAVRAMSLADIAALTAEEGCVGETLGAALAEEQAAIATDPEVAAILRRVAADEARHAQLAWRFAAWAAREGGDDVRRAIALAVERAASSALAMEVRSYDGVDLDAWHAHGRLTCAEAKESASRTIEQVVLPCLAQVAGRDAMAATARRRARVAEVRG